MAKQTDSYEVGRDPHEDLVRMLRDQDELGSKPQIFEPALFIGNRENLHIDPTARIDSFTKFEIGQQLRIGKCVHIASFAHVGIGGGTTLLDDYSAVASGARLVSGSNQYDMPSMSPLAPSDMQRIVKSFVRLHRYACVLPNAVVRPGVTLHEGAILAPGGIALKDIPAWEIWGGVPAVFIKKRELR